MEHADGEIHDESNGIEDEIKIRNNVQEVQIKSYIIVMMYLVSTVKVKKNKSYRAT